MSPIGPDSQLGVARTLKALRARVDGWRSTGLTVGFVPTMGALHKGHISLVRHAAKLSDRVVASIFINPKQFAAHEDLATYPRNEAADLEMLAAAGCHLAWCPSPEEMYPAGYQTAVSVEAVAAGLESDSRPHFFGGVATVVCKLLNQVRPTVAVFGEKDYQQLLVIKRMVKDLDMPVQIVGGETVRESDGLAMSSRNAYLNPQERKIAAKLNEVLAALAEKLEAGAPVDETMIEGRTLLGAAGFDRIDYLETRSAADLESVGLGPLKIGAPARVLAAVVVGRTRLIDNWPVARV
ncbi:MAG: pantoate--beta-alanine ligase [Pseudomonadota bacterium]|nr:pantoate--beta-alanine ligase [Pseudomonadota bacterium]